MIPLPYKIIAALLLLGTTFGIGYGCSWAASRDELAKAAADAAVQQSQLNTLRDEAKKTEKELTEARAKAESIRVITTERVREVQSTTIGPGCDAALDFLRAEAPKIRNRDRHVIED